MSDPLTEARAIIADLLEWNSNTGGWEADCWARAKTFMGHPADDDEPDPAQCTGACKGLPSVEQWAYTGTAYGGDDERYHGEGRCYCVFCGADGDA